LSLKSLLPGSRIVAEPNKTLTPEITASLGAAFGTYLENRGTVALARDYRRESRMLKRAFVAGLMSAGINAMDLTIAPIPVLQFAIRRFGASGGAMFTSHHAHHTYMIELKFYDRSGIEFNVKKTEELLELCDQNKIKRAKLGEVGNLIQTEQIADLYERAITQFVDTSLFKDANMQIVVDCSNGPIGAIIPSILTQVGVDIIALNSYAPSILTGLPTLNSLKRLSTVISSTNATFGVCFDVDGSRAIFFDERGNYISSDLLLTLFVLEELKKGAKIFITTETTTAILEQVISNVPDAKLIRVKNIPGTVATAMRMHQAHFGGSDTGKLRFPEYALFSDTALVTLKLLEIIAKSKKTLTDLLATVPQTIKTEYELALPEKIFLDFHEILEDNLGDMKVIDTLIGVKVFFGPELGWIHVIPSFHENKLLLRGEIVNPAKATELFKTIEYALEGKLTKPRLK
jgi:phosphomannomutase/phosphoglucomutase